MSDFNQKEYQTVILAALLHDVGKMLHRGKEFYEGKHEVASVDFLDRHADKIRIDELFDFDLLKLLVRHHHSTKADAQKDAYFDTPEAYEKEKGWRLVSIVIDADCYSCVERDLQQQRKRDVEKRRAPLDSIFANMSLDLEKPEISEGTHYHLTQLNPLLAFSESFAALDEQEIIDRISAFEKELPDFSEFCDFDMVINVWLDLLETHTWAVPSDTRYEVSDVSLYDHLRSSAALAACLYKRHIDNINSGKNLKRSNEVCIIGGDFSGIQEYIFSITSREQKGLSKRLRARSFFISAYCEAVVHRILHTLGLPPVCNVFSAGGKFLLLSPCTDDSKNKLEEAKRKIEADIHCNHFNQFSFLLCQREMMTYTEETRVKNFFRLADEIFHALETEKTRKCHSSLIDEGGGTWSPEAFVATELYQSYAGSGDCPVCGRGPALCEDRTPEEEGVSRCCVVCHRDKFDIGQVLPKARYVAYAKGRQDNRGAIPIFRGDDAYHIDIMATHSAKPGQYLIQYIGPQSEFPQNAPRGCVHRYLANHVPTDNWKLLTFQEIAAKSRRTGNNGQTGSELLGVLKADIDNLGLIFSKGFEKRTVTEAGVEEDDYKTISRFLTLSRMIELFFSGWAKEVMERDGMDKVIADLAELKGLDGDRLGNYIKHTQIDFRDIYTVYSGGDDMLLVGPWETMIIFAMYLNQQFRVYTCNNPDITLSAGLALVKPRFPIAAAVRQADELLEKSKQAGKDRITLFGTTVEWGRMAALAGFFLVLNEQVRDAKIKTTFLHRLLEYHQQALEFIDNNKVEGLRYLSLLSYDIGRNLRARDKPDGGSAFNMFRQVIDEKPSVNSLIYAIKISASWAIFSNR